MTGCFACPLFNFLIGFNLSSMRIIYLENDPTKSIFSQGISFNLFDENARVVALALIAIILVLLSFIYGVPNNAFKFSSRQAYVRVAIYATFIGFLIFLL